MAGDAPSPRSGRLLHGRFPPRLLPLLALLFGAAESRLQAPTPGTPQCSLSDEDFANDPAMRTMAYDLGYGPQEFRAYVQPDVSEFYPRRPGTYEAKTPRFTGFAAKFVNMSTRSVRIFWDPRDGSPGVPMFVIAPFNSDGTASFPGHAFYATPATLADDPGPVLERWDIQPPRRVYYHDPITVEGDEGATQANLDALTADDFAAYQEHVSSQAFGEQYRDFTGREYLATWPRGAPPHKIWPADYFGQEHWVTTRETHFVDEPPQDELGRIKAHGAERILREDEPRLLSEYRSREPYLNMTLKVLSCAPRVFQIDNFLSLTGVNHILFLTTGMKLHKSTTAGDNTRGDLSASGARTRTSLNTWVYRETDAIVDAIYRRAADLTRIDEALLRRRSRDEHGHLRSSGSLAEALQLVHYVPGQKYTANHDFGYADFGRNDQPARFLTLLLYLNEPEAGGATQFPRWANAETRDGLDTAPAAGRAVLFYSQLPDGNMDDLSQHAALPVTQGEKWLMNLWVWDPEYN